jgi:ATP-dependent Lhr-like helicase
MIDTKTLLLCLDAIEEQESKLLAWGDTDVSLSFSEILSIIQKIVGMSLTNEDVVDLLVSRCLIFKIAFEDGQSLYRSRMAETIRLHVLSRQWFHGKNLEQAKTLVSDFRFVRRARRYPKRTEKADMLLETWKVKLSLSESELEILDALLKNNGNEYSLSGFQVRSTVRITEKYREHKNKQKMPSATIVCSGTGSGKTLSFYLPAMSQLAHNLITDSSNRVRILAIYPKNELLKDQFSETYEQARRLDKFLESRGCRKIRIGTLFGDTFYRNYTEENEVFNTMSCPEDGCDGDLLWQKNKINSLVESVVCNQCQKVITTDELGLTREGQLDNPPDILFTTTEMLNQRLGDSKFSRLFGVGSNYMIPLVLLDEVHTYEGTSGAQTSFLLKRWMQRSRIKPHFVGLSATLDDAVGFFSDLTGTPIHQVELVEPFEDEMEEEGAEYLLALRGDPVSQSALLSTTIQATMLTSRMLDVLSGPNQGVSKGIFGQKLFVFTDDLDVINRLYDQLLDAEGWQRSYQRIAPKDIPSLAYLRSPHHPDQSHNYSRIRLGQNWSVAEHIGHDLSATYRANIGRTSSQDTGVSCDSEIIVATASLEVGFNDPSVGAVVQHKAPRGAASYLQRKGRAGRKRGMRPWMYTVLSDFGRDRVAFQQYEQLINPRVKALKLPVTNSHIHKMQAAMATLEWLSECVGGINIWKLLKEPKDKFGKVRSLRKLNELQHLVSHLLNAEVELNKLEIYLGKALLLGKEQIQCLMWQSPRSIALEFLPNLLQKLKTFWGANGIEWESARGQSGPMPDFIAQNLFSDLSSPSLQIRLQRGSIQDPDDDWESMNFFQGIKEFAPGRISKRFTIKHKSETDWLVPPKFKPQPGQKEAVNFEIEQALFGKGTQEFITTITTKDGVEIGIYQPTRVQSSRFRDGNYISETSNAFLEWQSEFRATYDQDSFLKPPNNSDWTDLISGVQFFTHEEMNPVELIRYNCGSKATIKFRGGGDDANINFRWTDNNQPVGIGTRLWVDGMYWLFNISIENIICLAEYGENKKALRLSYIEDTFLSAPCFLYEHFFAQWIYECAMSAMFIIMDEKNLCLTEALTHLGTQEGQALLCKVPSEVFQMRDVTTDDGDKPEEKEQELQKNLVSYFSNSNNISEMQKAFSAITEDNGSDNYIFWLKDTFGNTIAGGVNKLVSTLLPDVSDGEVLVDHFWEGPLLHLWITESENGGVGVITRLRDTYLEDPLNVMNLFSNTFDAEEYEQVDFDLRYLLAGLHSETEIKNAFTLLRTASSYKQRYDANISIQTSIGKIGIPHTHVWNNMLHTRILRPGSSTEKDILLATLLLDWDILDAKFGIELPLNMASNLLARRHNINQQSLNKQRNLILGLLWQRGAQTRQSGLSFYNRFGKNSMRMERLLLNAVTSNDALTIQFENGWESKLEEALLVSGRSVLKFSPSNRAKISSSIVIINTMSVESQGLSFYPRLSRIKREQGDLLIFVEIAEVIQ